MRSSDMFIPLWRFGKGVILTLILLGIISGCTPASDAKVFPIAEQGIIDLTDWSWDRDGIVPLDGQWKFDWLQPSNLGESQNNKYTDTTLEVPGTWGSIRTGSGVSLQDKGIGIYRLLIKHQAQRDMMAIRLPNISTAYEFSIDGSIVASRGHIDQITHRTVPFQLPATVYFQALGEQTDLKLVVANDAHRSGGIRTEIVIGNADLIQQLQVKRAAQELIVLGCLIMIGFYHLGLFILRRKEYANILFAMLCLFVGIRMGLLGEGFILQWMPMLTWDLAIRIEYVAFILSGWSGFCYFQTMYSQEIKRIWFILSSFVGAILILCVLLLDTLVFTSWILAFQLYILILSARILSGLVVSGMHKREGARLALIGMAGMVLTIVNDMLFYNGWWNSIDLVPFGLLFLIVMNSFIISLKFSLTYERVEQMSAELVEWNSSLEEKIADRTDELQRSYVTLEDAKTELERMEHSRKQLISNISHDLRTPITLLQGYLEALRDNIITDPVQRETTIRLMLSKVEGLNSLIQDLFDLSVLEARKVELTLEDIPLSRWKDRLMEQYSLEMQQKKIRFNCKLVSELTWRSAITIDIHRMDRVFAN
ncbi:sensor histidine kinase, partial [Cohnella sp.]|uniref:sensor histidine kinase n=1 Tax=Cohnella sp. TaxID=1883426 RepID=UPI003567C027